MKRTTVIICLATLLLLWLAAPFLPEPPILLHRARASGISSGAVGGFDPLDTSVNWWREEFGSGAETFTTTDTTGTLGSLGWMFRIRGNGGTIAHLAGAFPNNGIYRITTAATAADDGGGISFSGSGRQPFGNHAGNTNWGTVWIFRLNGTASERMSVGSTQACAGATAANVSEGFRVRYDTALGDTNFTFGVIAAGTETALASAVAVNTNFNTLLVNSTVAGTWRFQLNGGAVVTACASGCDITATLTTVALTPCAFLVSATAAGARTMDVDFWAWRNTR